MKAAFSTWLGSVAPLFDEAREILLVDTRSGRVVEECTKLLAGTLPIRRALELEEMGAQVLVCGAISRPIREALEANGIRVIPFVSGQVDDIVQAWMGGFLMSDRYCMPGCRGRGRFRRRHPQTAGGSGRSGAGRGGEARSRCRRRQGKD